MNIMMILNGRSIGGAELQFIELAHHMRKNHRVSIICLHGDQAPSHVGLEKGISLYSFPYHSRGASIPKISQAIRCGTAIKPDVIISTSVIGNAVAVIIASFTKSKLLSMQTVSKPMAYPRLDQAVLKRFDVLIAGCTDIRNYLLHHEQREERIEVINNWVDFSDRKAKQSAADTRRQLGIPEETVIIGCIGRMHYQKGQEFLIKAFQKLTETREGFKLLLVGDGPRIKEMREQANGHPDIVFTGTAEGDDYNNLLNVVDIYVQPSRFEGLPRTLLDAMFMGKPVIASAVNGNCDAVKDLENGLLVLPEDGDTIVAAINKLLDAPELAKSLGIRAHGDVVAHFSADLQMTKIEQLVI